MPLAFELPCRIAGRRDRQDKTGLLPRMAVRSLLEMRGGGSPSASGSASPRAAAEAEMPRARLQNTAARACILLDTITHCPLPTSPCVCRQWRAFSGVLMFCFKAAAQTIFFKKIISGCPLPPGECLFCQNSGKANSHKLTNCEWSTIALVLL